MQHPSQETSTDLNGYDRGREALNGQVNAGTADLWHAATAEVMLVVPDHLAAISFLEEYRIFDANRGEAEEVTTNPSFLPAISAINNLRAAQAQNIMADPALRAAVGHYRQAAWQSPWVSSTSALVVDTVLRSQSAVRQAE